MKDSSKFDQRLIGLMSAIEAINSGTGVGWNSPYKIMYVDGIVDRIRLFIQTGKINYSIPHTLAVEPTMVCNLACNFCSHYDRNMSAEEIAKEMGKYGVNMTQDALIQIRDLAVKLRSGVVFGGGGEPTFWYDPTGEISRRDSMKWLKDEFMGKLGDAGCNMSIATNFVLGGDFAEVFAKHFTYLMLNVPTTDSELYRKITNTNVLPKVLENIRKLVALRDEFVTSRLERGLKEKVKINVRVVVDRDNIPSLLTTAKELIDLGVDFVAFRTAGDFETHDNGICSLGKIELEDYMSENAAEIFLLPKDKTNLSAIFKLKGSMVSLIDGDTKGDGLPCWFQRLALRNVFAPSGTYPCTQFVGRNVTPANDSMWSVGNASTQPLVQILGSKRHESVTNFFSETTAAGTCSEMRHCSQGYFNPVLQTIYEILKAGLVIPEVNYGLEQFFVSKMLDDGSFV